MNTHKTGHLERISRSPEERFGPRHDRPLQYVPGCHDHRPPPSGGSDDLDRLMTFLDDRLPPDEATAVGLSLLST